MELDDKGRNWGPAKGYYDLAAELDPNNGQSYHQLAIMAREDNDYFRVTYYLYRSLACKVPHPIAKQNLELGFKKIIAAWTKGESISNKNAQDGSSGALALWFCVLHSKCYKGDEFAVHDELENEVLSNLAIDLKERPLDHILQKIILTNIAAEYFSTIRMQGKLRPHRYALKYVPTDTGSDVPENIVRTYFFYLRLNVKTFFTLLQILQPELERLSEGEDVTQNGDRAPQLSDKITVVARRVLPALRLYSTWFSITWHVLDASIGDANTLTTVEVQELWKSYAATLSLLTSSFPVPELPNQAEDYMLEEDMDTSGFQPLCSRSKKRWYINDTIPKKKPTEQERNHPNVEMLMRVRDLLIDGLALVQDENAPLDLDGLRFIYREEGVPSELLASPNNRPDGSPAMTTEPMDFPLFPQEVTTADVPKAPSVAAASDSTSVLAKDVVMNRMVDDLLGTDDGLGPLAEEEENIPPTPPAQTFEDTTLVNDSVYGLGSININDLVNSVQNYKPSGASPTPGTPLLAMPMNRVASSSSIRRPADLPSLPDGRNNGSSIWNRNGPASPLLGNGFDVRGSPLNGVSSSPHLGHRRGNSSNSVHSNGWDGYPSSSTPVQRYTGGLGGGAAWGNPESSPYANIYGNGSTNGWNQNPQSNYADPDMASPLLFGKNSSWNQNMGHSSYYRTPPNGQGG